MKKNCQHEVKWLFLKSDQMNWIPVSKQTQSIHENINSKIRQLGDKYYQVKHLFDQLNLRRDFLFFVGREIEEDFKNQKKGIHLQTQYRRSKEALTCWFTEFFYNELFYPDSPILNRLKESGNKETSKKLKKNNSDNNNSKLHNNQLLKEKKVKDAKEQLIGISNSSLFSDMKFNKEIDNFQCCNDEKEDSNNSPLIQNVNFNYDQLLNFD